MQIGHPSDWDYEETPQETPKEKMDRANKEMLQYCYLKVVMNERSSVCAWFDFCGYHYSRDASKHAHSLWEEHHKVYHNERMRLQALLLALDEAGYVDKTLATYKFYSLAEAAALAEKEKLNPGKS